MGAAEVEHKQPELICIVGPTASGKSRLAVELAERYGGEIISADSVQIYRHFDIGSGKPEPAERGRVPHHLIDCAEPDEDWDASVFAERAHQAVHDVRSRGRLPLVCGGTFLWVRALVYGLAPAPPKDEQVRERHREYVERHGRAALHARLREIDPPSFERLMPNDFVRVSRALEVYEVTGKRLSDLQQAHGFRVPRYRARMLGIHHDAEALTQRIRRRVQQMLEAGWIAEVAHLIEAGFGQTRAMASVGYRQVFEALQAETSPPPEQLADEITRVTRIFARRQRTWLREQAVTWISDGASHGYRLPRDWIGD